MTSASTLFFVRRAKIGCVSGLVGGFAIFVSIFVIDLSLASAPGTFYKMVGLPVGMSGIEATLFGMISHMLTAALIGTVFGIGSGLSRKLDILSVKKGAIAGMVTGLTVFFVFFIPINVLVMVPTIHEHYSDTGGAAVLLSNTTLILVGSLEMHVVYGAVMGVFFAIAVQYESKRQIIFHEA